MKYYFLLLISLVFISCNNKQVKQETVRKKPAMNVVHQHTVNVLVDKAVVKKIEAWSFYASFEKKIAKYYSISASEALNNAIDLAQEATRLKNNKKPIALTTNSFKTRIDVLENEALRLKDMTYIPAITAAEVNKQVDKILAAFAATNSKINSVFTKLQVEKEIKIKT